MLKLPVVLRTTSLDDKISKRIRSFLEEAAPSSIDKTQPPPPDIGLTQTSKVISGDIVWSLAFKILLFVLFEPLNLVYQRLSLHTPSVFELAIAYHTFSLSPQIVLSFLNM
jgi:hypothetical protein